jgi:hypothetical protein
MPINSNENCLTQMFHITQKKYGQQTDIMSVDRICVVENTGFEPVASCLPGKRSSQMS